MRLTQLSVDWKEDFDGEDITDDLQKVGGKKIVVTYDQNTVDSKIIFLLSEPLSQAQLNELWEKGDLYTGDRIWSGRTFKDIINKIEKYIIKELERETK